MASINVLDKFLLKLGELADLASDVRGFEALVAKHEVKALRELLDKVRPLMPYMDAPIPTREEWVGPQGGGLGPHGLRAPEPSPDRRTHTYKEPGLVLVNNFEATVEDQSGQMRHSGYKIIFTRSGKLVQLDRMGSWSEERQSTFWSCDAHEVDVDAEFVERHLGECIGSIAQALERAAKRQRDKREALRERLKMLRAIQRILAGGESSDARAPEAGAATRGGRTGKGEKAERADKPKKAAPAASATPDAAAAEAAAQPQPADPEGADSGDDAAVAGYGAG